MMTVKQLLSKLQKMPKNAVVGFADADASPGAVSSWVTSVEFRTKEVLPDYLAGENGIQFEIFGDGNSEIVDIIIEHIHEIQEARIAGIIVEVFVAG